MWIGRVYAAVQQVGNIVDQTHVMTLSRRLSLDDLHGRTAAADGMKPILYRSLAMAELNASAVARGAFIPAGNEFDAFAAVDRVLSTADADLLIVDPYMDELTLSDFAVIAAQHVAIRLLSDEQHVKPSLLAAATRWRVQNVGMRPLEAQLAPARSLHDRLIIVDSRTAWILDGRRCSTEFPRPFHAHLGAVT